VLKEWQPRLLTFGVADENAWEVGLACGGTIKVFVEPSWALDGIYTTLKQNLEARQPIAVVNVLQGQPDVLNRKLVVYPDGRTEGDLQTPTDEIVPKALDLLIQETGGVIDLEDGTSLFIEVYPLPPRLIIVGAVHFADPLVTIANAVGFDTILIDPRKAYATRERFPHAKQIMVEWPQEALPKMLLNHSAYVVILTHDPKLDDPALQICLDSKARYIGALGSKRTNNKRRERLLRAGMTDEQFKRLHAPVGLDIGGHSPGEIAVSIMAEIIQVRNHPVGSC
jgi:xanthine dehydrogenase accessory factor